MTTTGDDQKLSYVVGTEKKLRDVLAEADVLPLLRGVVQAGASEAALTDADGSTLWVTQGAMIADPTTAKLLLILEGEAVGSVIIKGKADSAELLSALAGLLQNALASVMQNNLKRMLATELHTNVVNLSYDELLETNNRLRASETKYRELAGVLEQKVAERTQELKRAHTLLLQQEKMASIGQLAAGVAHELNTPLGYVSSNIQTLNKYFSRLGEMLGYYETAMQVPGVSQAAVALTHEKHSALKLDFILTDGAQLITQSLAGIEKAAKIVSDLKGFSHVDDAAILPADLNDELDKTLNVLTHQVPPGARIIRDYGKLRPIVCKAALLGQVFLNLILNAFDARQDGLELVITTRETETGDARVRFADNGPGIPEDIRQRIFDPFFTTKEVGKGAGMGLSVAYDIMTSLQGTLTLEDTPRRSGASFVITLPRKGEQHAEIR
jgi:hypothetical protein